MRFLLFSSSGTYSPLSCARVHGKISELEAAYWLESSYSAIHKGPFKKKLKTEPSEDVWWGKNLYNAALNKCTLLLLALIIIIIITYFLRQKVFPPPHHHIESEHHITLLQWVSIPPLCLAPWYQSNVTFTLEQILDQYLGRSNLFCPIKKH